ncbi:hypothetical protein [Robertkochia flava]|uniref:hypothetical protein n=1 Tax=Robertkochia flava TaxID=3447986 RepID=UPI001CCD4510|nr:hypothetical protein [Robertkochia marina]
MKKTLFLIGFLIFSTSTFSQFKEAFQNITSSDSVDYSKYDKVVFEASNYVFENPVDYKSEKYFYANKLIGKWMNDTTDFGFPLFGPFYEDLSNKEYQKYYYRVALVNYALNQKFNHNRLLTCKPIPGEVFREQKDVKEIQLGAAGILIEYCSEKSNNLKLNRQMKKYVEAFKNETLAELM